MLAAGQTHGASSPLGRKPLPALRSPLGRRFLLLGADQRPRSSRGPLVTLALADPWKMLGVAQDASEKDIKRAHRKLVLQCHPDLSKDDPNAEARFLQIQEAYEIILGRRRGKEVDASANGTSWEFHDWYWRFSMSKRWGRGKKGAAQAAAASATPPPSSQWKSQLDGLKRKAAAKRMQQQQRPQRNAWAAEQQPSWARRYGHAAGQQAAAATQAEQTPEAQQEPRAQTMQRPEQTRQSATGPAPAAHVERQQQEPCVRAASASMGAPAQYAREGSAEAGGLGGMRAGAQPGAGTSVLHPHLGWSPSAAESSHVEDAGHHFEPHHSTLANHSQHVPPPAPEQRAAHTEQPQHAQHPEQQQHQQGPLPLSDLMGRVVGSVHRLGGEPGGLQNHIVRLVRRASQLSQHLQVQLLKLRVLSVVREDSVSHAQHSAQHAQHAELHVEFEETVRLWQLGQHHHHYQRQPGSGAADAGPLLSELAGSSAAAGPASAAAQEGGSKGGSAAAGDAEGSQGALSPDEYARRSRRFVNDGQVRERVTSQLAGLKRRANLRQEFCE